MLKKALLSTLWLLLGMEAIVYVCICKAVTEEQIRQAQARGCQNLEQLQQQLGVATGCGSCLSMVKTLLGPESGQKTGSAAPTVKTGEDRVRTRGGGQRASHDARPAGFCCRCC